MAKFITHYNNKYELINLDLIENIYAMLDKENPIKDSDGFYTLILDASQKECSEQYIEKFKTIEELEKRLDEIMTIANGE